ncbi:MAG TPA: DinB family protein [Gemmatimonadales bacterium]|nr:DinB family protein [Gemmatimonadales bacterium]
MRYDFLRETYATERLKVLATWSTFRDEDLPVRPHPTDPRGRSVHEQMVHQCVSENAWFRDMLGIDVGAPPLPSPETRLGFLQQYAHDSGLRLAALARTDEMWWEEEVAFFDVRRTRAWIVVRRVAHTAHHRGQQVELLRMLGRSVYSTYGPTADTGGLPLNHAPTIYPYNSEAALFAGELAGGQKENPLPGPGEHPPTERPAKPAR